MFIPNDGAMISAIDNDDAIVSYALDRKIALVSPSQIMSVIMLVAQIWRKEAQDRNATEIARLGDCFYDSAKDFLSDLQSIEKESRRSPPKLRISTFATHLRLTRSFLARAERLRDLGAKPPADPDNIKRLYTFNYDFTGFFVYLQIEVIQQWQICKCCSIMISVFDIYKGIPIGTIIKRDLKKRDLPNCLISIHWHII